jgi:uncharacterized membrane protein YhaH (DUF805 family)
MEPINWFMKVVTQHYFDFNGRARRAELWWFFLVYLVIAVVLGVIQNIVGLGTILSGLFGLAMLLPNLGVQVRRLHDTGRSGWWWLIALTGIGIILLIVWYVTEGTKGPNEYGPDPKATV